jgi:hypothetical protein
MTISVIFKIRDLMMTAAESATIRARIFDRNDPELPRVEFWPKCLCHGCTNGCCFPSRLCYPHSKETGLLSA